MNPEKSRGNAVRNFLIVVSTCSAITILMGPAYGDVRRPIKGIHSIGDIARACMQAGGATYSTSDGYGCLKGNCDGKGGECAVDCDNGGKCTGSTPTIVTGKKVGSHANPSAVLSFTGGRPSNVLSRDNLLDGNTVLPTGRPSAVGTPVGGGGKLY